MWLLELMLVTALWWPFGSKGGVSTLFTFPLLTRLSTVENILFPGPQVFGDKRLAINLLISTTHLRGWLELLWQCPFLLFPFSDLLYPIAGSGQLGFRLLHFVSVNAALLQDTEEVSWPERGDREWITP
ncbi:hypothetical protein JAAARDRAFT_53695 [Jaapia argillacea MUCL 33604]|uniref:Secreted protein n=1 Tax=Jaapia argillacea MUCL 33604 TaxID=933084 RepID=A0A067Q968_9AGAM|nr:hypothetical protein JAAARDRAFT_53695 [Jaapia argillacea MUCL 33604]